jgi:hypothetical protein
MEDMIRLFRKQLFEAFWSWVETNKEAIGEKWYSFFQKKGNDAEAECDTAIKIMGTGLWMFNMIVQFGVLAGMGPKMVNIQEINPKLDEKSTKRLLLLIQACMNLQFLPPSISDKEIPVITSKKFSLKLWTEQHH